MSAVGVWGRPQGEIGGNARVTRSASVRSNRVAGGKSSPIRGGEPGGFARAGCTGSFFEAEGERIQEGQSS